MAKAKGFFRKRSSIELKLYEELDWKALQNEYYGCCGTHSQELSSNGNDPDWADLLAGQWMDVIKSVYKVKGLGEDKISAPIVKTQGEQFAKAINGVFSDKDIDFDSPDLYMREVLKRNTWDFSVAKNYNDNIAINNLLLKEDGSLRSWSDFKYEAQKIVGNSIKYLKTEYDTIVKSAQMSRLWAEIQRDKHIFPYVQILVVQDGRTSEICKPLHNLIFEVDDPVLAYYFPPNHFNCRTMVKKLRHGVATQNYELPEIPEAFKNNVGKTGKIFTDDNRYIENTPKEVLALSNGFYNKNERNERYKDIEFKQERIGKGILERIGKGRQYKHEFKANKEAFTILAKAGYKVRMLPIIEDGNTNPDGFNRFTQKYMDVKAATGTNGKNIVQSGMKEASRQNAPELVIYLKQKPDSYRTMYEALKNAVRSNYSKNVEKVIVIFPDESIKEYSIERIRELIKKAQT